jgi:DNA-binding transcriptional LysR family regulator
LTSSPGPELAFGDERYLGAGAAMHSLALAGHGVCVLPDYMTRSDLAEGRLVRLFGDRPVLSDSFRLLYRTDSALSTTLGALARFLSERPLT